MNSRCETKVTYCFSHCNLFVRIESVNFQDNVSYRHRFGDGGGGFSGRAGGSFCGTFASDGEGQRDHPRHRDREILERIRQPLEVTGVANGNTGSVAFAQGYTAKSRNYEIQSIIPELATQWPLRNCKYNSPQELH
jgi:hypothetical protein